MNISSLVEKFISSVHGQNAAAALSSAGIDDSQVQDILGHAARAGVAHVEQAHKDNGGILGEHAGMSFFAAFASGIIKGDGVMGSLEDGAGGVVIARITEALTAKMGLDSTTADAAAAATAPYVMSFLKEELNL
jgi:hypothetical protein